MPFLTGNALKYKEMTRWTTRVLECSNFFFSSRRRHTRLTCDWSSDVCSSDLHVRQRLQLRVLEHAVVEHADDAAADREQPARRIRAAVRQRWHECAARRASAPRSEERRVGKEGRSGWMVTCCSAKSAVYQLVG